MNTSLEYRELHHDAVIPKLLVLLIATGCNVMWKMALYLGHFGYLSLRKIFVATHKEEEGPPASSVAVKNVKNFPF